MPSGPAKLHSHRTCVCTWFCASLHLAQTLLPGILCCPREMRISFEVVGSSFFKLDTPMFNLLNRSVGGHRPVMTQAIQVILNFSPCLTREEMNESLPTASPVVLG
jgi:hypothetical protein